ncbi:MAG: RsmE family RNA methyltransferase [Armatimonadota bacterium]
MMRFLVPGVSLKSDFVSIPADVCHHAFRVRRLRTGETFMLINGMGDTSLAVIDEWSHGVGQARLVGGLNLKTELPIDIVVCQALPKSPERIEQVLQHGTELGAAAFHVFAADRSVAKLETKDKVTKRLERWSSIIRSAAEQSGRTRLPSIHWHVDLNDALVQVNLPLLVLHEEADTSLRSVVKLSTLSSGGLALIVGPEGGLSPAEVETCRCKSGVAISLGPRILRTETAALVAIAQLSYVLESEQDGL